MLMSTPVSGSSSRAKRSPPAMTPRCPVTALARSATMLLASSSSPHTSTSSSVSGPLCFHRLTADTWWNAPTKRASGTNRWPSSAALPSATSKANGPFSSKPSGFTQLTTILPDRAGANDATSSSWPSYGTASRTFSAFPAAARFSSPSTETVSSPVWRTASAISAALSAARLAAREPLNTSCPARASRYASPRPCGPVPPITAIFTVCSPFCVYVLRQRFVCTFLCQVRQYVAAERRNPLALVWSHVVQIDSIESQIQITLDVGSVCIGILTHDETTLHVFGAHELGDLGNDVGTAQVALGEAHTAHGPFFDRVGNR